jgi:hypothetical protein
VVWEGRGREASPYPDSAYKEYETKIPTILLLLGWRIFFYANEGNEPVHVHCRKGEKECKYWLDRENFDLEEAYAYNLSSRDRREIKQIIFEPTLSNP